MEVEMQTVELFCGTKSFSNYAEECECEVYTVDVDSSFNPSLVCNLLEPLPDILKRRLEQADIIWMSPPCQTFSMASGNTHWTEDRKPKTPKAIDGYNMLMLCKWVADNCMERDKTFFIENPRSRARWFLPVDWRQTVWYCQYGDLRAKPTDIWTNLKNWTGKQCHNGNRNCHHEPAPRGSKTGTQGLQSRIDRSRIPEELFQELFKIIFKYNREIGKI